MSHATVIAVLVGGLFFLFVRTWNRDSGGTGRLAEIPFALIMFAAAMAGSVGTGWIAFRSGIFRTDLPSAQVFTTGALLAAVLTLTRIRKTAPAVILALAWLVYQGGAGVSAGRGTAGVAVYLVWALVMILGVLIIALLWDLLVRRGVHLGKCLLCGPLLGGVYLAAAPVTFLGNHSPNAVMRTLLLNFFLGIVIGDGVGLGVELVELIRRRPGERPAGEAAG